MSTPPNPEAFAASCDHSHQSGMSLRDYFAAAALTGLLAAHADPKQSPLEMLPDLDDAAAEAYAFADAMLERRQVNTTTTKGQ